MLRLWFPRRLRWLVLSAAAFGFFYAWGVSPPDGAAVPLEDLLLARLFEEGPPDPSGILNGLVRLFPVLFCLFTLCGYFTGDLSSSGAYIFTRIRHRSTWYFSKLAALAAYACAYGALYLGGGVLSLCVRGIAWRCTERTAAVLAASYGLLALFLILSGLLVNLLSLRIPANFSFFAVFVLLLGGLALSCLTYQAEEIPPLFRLSPVSHYFYAWHTERFPPAESFVYLSAGILALGCAGLFLFNHMDLSLEDLESR